MATTSMEHKMDVQIELQDTNYLHTSNLVSSEGEEQPTGGHTMISQPKDINKSRFLKLVELTDGELKSDEDEKYQSANDNMLNYAFSTFTDDKLTNEYKEQIREILDDNKFINHDDCTIKRFTKDVIKRCGGNEDLKNAVNKLYNSLDHYEEYTNIIQQLPDPLEKNTKDSCCRRCCALFTASNKHVQILSRIITKNKTILKGIYVSEDDTANIKLDMPPTGALQMPNNLSKDKSSNADSVTISVLEENTAIKLSVDSQAKHIIKHDILSHIIIDEKQQRWQSVEGLARTDVVSLLKLMPLESTLIFTTQKRQCCRCLDGIRGCCKKKEEKESICEFSISKILEWLVKFMKVTLTMIAAHSEVLNAATDAILLYKSARHAEHLLFTMGLFVSLVAPYILSYSSGVQIFLYRKTFENVQLFTFKSLLLGLYLFPTGVLYFVLLDFIDALLQFYIWFSFGVIGKIKTKSELAQIESGVARYFGMSRMDWFSFKKQKIMAQLFFETVPQLTLQALLFFDIISGKNSQGITDRDLIISLSSAFFSSIMQLFRLNAESGAVKETFVHYALNCITARFGWVAYRDKIEEFQKRLEKEFKKRCWGCCGNKGITDKILELDYSLHYNLPLVTYLTSVLSKKSSFQPLEVAIRHKKSKTAYGSVEYDFSSKTVNTLISTIKSLKLKNDTQIKITFGEALRLLSVREIISLMQTCSAKNILLPDIHLIDWHQAFDNTNSRQDPRLFSHTFDENDRTLLISLYLTGYDGGDHSIMRSFVHDFDVPLTSQDNEGNTILHHMIKQKDYDSINVLLSALKPKQRIHFDVQNDEGDTIVHQQLKNTGTSFGQHIRSVTARAMTSFAALTLTPKNQIPDVSVKTGIDDYEELKDLLDLIKKNSKSGQKFNIFAFNRSGESVMFLALERDGDKLRTMTGREKMLKVGTHDYQQSNNYQSNIQKSEVQISVMQKDIALILDNVEEEDIYDDIEHETIINIMHFLDNNAEYSYTPMKERMDEYSQSKRFAQIDNTKLNGNTFGTLDENMMHQLLLQEFPDIVYSKIHSERKVTTLGYILMHFTDYFYYFNDIIDFLLQTDAIFNQASLLYPLFVYAIQKPEFNIIDTQSCFDLFQKIIDKYHLSLEQICDDKGNNPIHYMMRPHSKEYDLEILSLLCQKYPQWMTMKNKRDNNRKTGGVIPLFLAISNEDINSFFCLMRYMSDNKINVKEYLKQREFVDKMIYFGFDLLKNEEKEIGMRLLLTTFSYDDIFSWAQNDKFNNSHDSKDISLIKYVSETLYYDRIENVLFKSCNVNTSRLYNEKSNFDEMKEMASPKQSIVLNRQQNAMQSIDLVRDNEEKEEGKHEEKHETKANETQWNFIKWERKPAKLKLDKKEAIDWIEIGYSSVVEAFSALDLYTDILILIELYKDRHIWWTTFMLILLLAPYLVSHGSLVTLLQKKVNFYEIGLQYSFFLFFLSTPVSLFYLFMVDLCFMLFSVISTVWFCVIFVFASLMYLCDGVKNMGVTLKKYDIRRWIDQTVFEKWLRMNKTEIVGYRRLRTLSQLFFETMPQIILQIRMLWSTGLDEQVLAWSIGLAMCHLLLEAGIIYLDSSAYGISFLEYSMNCLGGRIQWIPFQHRIEDIIKNQFEMYHNTDNLPAESYKIPINDDNDDLKKQLILNYEDINFWIYHITYQFATQSIQRLTEMLRTSPQMLIPAEFKLTSTNVILQNFMKYLYCTAEIRLGAGSSGHIDLYQFCQLNQASTNKMKIVLQDRQKALKKLIKNTVLKTTKFKQVLSKKLRIKQLLLDYGFIQTESLKWIFFDQHKRGFSAQDKERIKLQILDKCLPSNRDDPLRLDLLRNVYGEKACVGFIGTSCEGMEKIKEIIDKHYGEKACRRDHSLYWVIIFILFYSTGKVFGCCAKGCHLLDSRLKYLLKTYIPYIKVGSFNIPFEFFENCNVFNELHHVVEELLINKCKNFILDHDKEHELIVDPETKSFDTVNNSIKQCKEWNYIKKAKQQYAIFYGSSNKEALKQYRNNRIQNLLNFFVHKDSADKMEVNDGNVALLDEMIVQFNFYLPNNDYLHSTLKYRQTKQHQVNFQRLQYEDNYMEKIETNPLLKKKKTRIFKRKKKISDAAIIDGELPNFIKIDENALLPIYDKNGRFQILSMVFKWEEEQNVKITLHDVQQSLLFFSTKKEEKEFELNMEEDLDEKHEKHEKTDYIRIDKNNITLAKYNHYLLHCEELLPTIKVECSDKIESLTVKYVQLFTEGNQQKLDEVREQKQKDENERKKNERSEKMKKKKNVDILLKTLKSQKERIDDIEYFYSNVVQLEFHEEWIPLIKNHHLLFKPLDHDSKKTVFHRLIDELKIDELNNIREYALLTSKFEYFNMYEKFGYCAFKLDYTKNGRLFKNCKYRIKEKQENKENEEEKTNKIQLKFNDIFWAPSNEIKSYDVYISNARIFGKGAFIFVHELKSKQFDIEQYKTDRWKLPVIYCPDRFYCQLLDGKHNQDDINDMRRIFDEAKYDPLDDTSSIVDIKEKIKQLYEASKAKKLKNILKKLTADIEKKRKSAILMQRFVRFVDQRIKTVKRKNVCKRLKKQDQFAAKKRKQQLVKITNARDADMAAKMGYEKDLKEAKVNYEQTLKSISTKHLELVKRVEKISGKNIIFVSKRDEGLLECKIKKDTQIKDAKKEYDRIVKIETEKRRERLERIQTEYDNYERKLIDMTDKYLTNTQEKREKYEKELKSIQNKFYKDKSRIEKITEKNIEIVENRDKELQENELNKTKQDTEVQNKYDKQQQLEKQGHEFEIEVITRQCEKTKKLITDKHNIWLELLPQMASLTDISKCDRNQIEFIILYSLSQKSGEHLAMYHKLVEEFLVKNEINGERLICFKKKYFNDLLLEEFKQNKEFKNMSNIIYKYKLNDTQISIEEKQELMRSKIESFEGISKCNEMEILFILNYENLSTFKEKWKNNLVNNCVVDKKINGNKLKSFSKQKFQSILKETLGSDKFKFDAGKLYDRLIRFKYKSNSKQKSINEEIEEAIYALEILKRNEIASYKSMANCREDEILFILNKDILDIIKNKKLKDNWNKINIVFKKYKLTGDRLSDLSKESFQSLLAREIFEGKNTSNWASGILYDKLINFKLNGNQQTLADEIARKEKEESKEEKKEEKKEEIIEEFTDEFTWIIKKNMLQKFDTRVYGYFGPNTTNKFVTKKKIRFLGKMDKTGMAQCQLVLTLITKRKDIKGILFDIECKELNKSLTKLKLNSVGVLPQITFNKSKIIRKSQIKWSIKSYIKLPLTQDEIEKRERGKKDGIRRLKIDKLSNYSTCNKEQIQFIFNQFVCDSLKIDKKIKTQIIKLFERKKITGQKLRNLTIKEFQNQIELFDKQLLKKIYIKLIKYKYYNYQISINDEIQSKKKELTKFLKYYKLLSLQVKINKVCPNGLKDLREIKSEYAFKKLFGNQTAHTKNLWKAVKDLKNGKYKTK